MRARRPWSHFTVLVTALSIAAQLLFLATENVCWLWITRTHVRTPLWASGTALDAASHLASRTCLRTKHAGICSRFHSDGTPTRTQGAYPPGGCRSGRWRAVLLGPRVLCISTLCICLALVACVLVTGLVVLAIHCNLVDYRNKAQEQREVTVGRQSRRR